MSIYFDIPAVKQDNGAGSDSCPVGANPAKGRANAR